MATVPVTVAARKKTKHGAYGRRLATVTIPVEMTNGFGDERAIHAAADVALRVLLPRLKFATEIVHWPVESPS